MKQIHYRSGAPYAVAAFVVFVLAAIFGMGSWWSYLLFALGLFLLYRFLRRVVFPDWNTSVDVLPKSTNPQIAALIHECGDQIKEVRRLSREIYEPQLRTRVDHIVDISVQLLQKLTEQPALQGQLRTFLRYYLPTLVKLLGIRVGLQNPDKLSPANQKTREKIDEALQMIEESCRHQLDAVQRTETLNVETEIQVLRRLNIFDDSAKSAEVMDAPESPQE